MTNRSIKDAGEIPIGLCQCGCGELTKIETRNSISRGRVAGRPRRYVKGHLPSNPNNYLVDEATGCWVWQGSRYAGYGRLNIKGAERSAHRYQYIQRHGTIPDGLPLDHLCRNRACVNPDHLEPVTHLENSHRGANTKLTAEQVRHIRSTTPRNPPARVLAERFGVSETRIRSIRRGSGWPNVPLKVAA